MCSVQWKHSTVGHSRWEESQSWTFVDDVRLSLSQQCKGRKKRATWPMCRHQNRCVGSTWETCRYQESLLFKSLIKPMACGASSMCGFDLRNLCTSMTTNMYNCQYLTCQSKILRCLAVNKVTANQKPRDLSAEGGMRKSAALSVLVHVTFIATRACTTAVFI